jgi:carbon monoxide dehydrogenase subunit G
LCQAGSLSALVEEQVTKSLMDMARKSFLSWEFEDKIRKRVQEKFNEKLEEVTDKMLSEITGNGASSK